MRIIAVDIGGTAIKAGVWDGTQILEYKEWETNASSGGAALMDRVKALIETYSSSSADGIGISTAGEVNAENGSILYANSNIPGYTGMPVKQMLENEFHVPVSVENDVNAAAIGELHGGAGRGYRDFLCVTYGTGVGGCIVMNGQVVRGATHCAGGFGGMIIHPECRDGSESLQGCYERCASTTALVEKVKAVDPSLDGGRKIFAAMDRKEVCRLIDEWINDICTGLINLIYIFNPPLVILGGGVMSQEYVRQEINRKVKHQLPPLLRDTAIVPAGLGNTAGMLGAAYLCAAEMRPLYGGGTVHSTRAGI